MNQPGKSPVQTRQTLNNMAVGKPAANKHKIGAKGMATSFEINYTNRSAPSLLHDLIHMIGYQVSSLLRTT